MRLQYRVPLLSAAIVLVIGLAAVPPLLYALRRASVEQFGAMAAGVAEVLEGHLESSAQMGGGHSIDQAVDELRGYPLLEDVVVFTGAGVADASLHLPLTGAPTDDSRVGEVLRTGKPITEPNSQNGVNQFDVITPILNKPACQGCHGTDRTVLGAMLVSLNTASQDAELRQQLLIVCLTGLAAFALIELVLTLSLKELVLNPLSRLGEAAGRISRGDYSAPVAAERDDEVGVLAVALNQMTQRVAEQTADLQQRGSRLESDVTRRTRELQGLNDVIAAASKSLDLGEVVGGALDKMIEALEFEAGVLCVGGASGEPDIVACRGLSAMEARAVLAADWAPEGTLRLGAASAETVELPSANGHSAASRARTATLDASFQTRVLLPIRSKDEALGSLCLLSRAPRAFDEQEMALLAAMADAVAVGVRNALISTRLREANREVTALLGRAVAGGFDVRFENPHLVRCWEETQCTETDCPAYGAANLRCWQIEGTLCPGGPSGTSAMKAVDCHGCPVFAKGCRHDEITSIGESFNNMMFLLDFEARQRAELASQLVEKLMAAQEEERKRVSRELHDETAQSLTSLLVGLKALEDVRSRKEFKAGAGQLERQTLGALDEVRRLALELRPAALDELGLAAALRGYLRDTMSRYPVEIDFRAEGLGARLSPGLETALYRIVQESVANAIRHGEARRILVSLEQRPSAIVARVRDDGKGFSTASLGRNGASRRAAPGHGLGLIGMKERAALFGGSLRVESRPGAGTTVSAEIPLAEASEIRPGGVHD